ncbi:tyrosine-type recombinase/integrase [Micromonospora sp. CA-248089]|uniref:tyrosine-type recombinase/integrase n=1 Tax=Micromonospora sp. CA-248089 TaxID=3239960 RepID=UPI003D8A8A71
MDAETEDSEAVLPLPAVTWLSLTEHQKFPLRARHSDGAHQPQPIIPRLRGTAGLPGVRLHDLRHTVVSLLIEPGISPHVVQAIARHADVKVTLKFYAHANLDAMRQALGKLDKRLS